MTDIEQIEDLVRRVTALEARLGSQRPDVCVYTAHDELAEYSTACGQTVQGVDEFCKHCGGRTILQGKE